MIWVRVTVGVQGGQTLSFTCSFGGAGLFTLLTSTPLSDHTCSHRGALLCCWMRLVTCGTGASHSSMFLPLNRALAIAPLASGRMLQGPPVGALPVCRAGDR